MALTFSAYSSPFTFSGSVTLQRLDLDILEPDSTHHVANAKDSTARSPESSFQIHGSGLVVREGSSDEVFESTFQVTEDTGTGKYFGLKGSGKMDFRLSNYEYDSSESEEEIVPLSPRLEKKTGRGSCIFELVNTAGASLK